MGFWEFVFRGIVIPILVLAGVMTTIPIWIWLERRVAGRIQQRHGPNRVGPAGLLQPLADAAKLLFKEDIIPAHVDRLLYLLAPVVSLIPSLAAFAVIPFGRGENWLWGGFNFPAQVADVNIGVLWILALSSLAVYGVVLAGWGSNNKWSLLGGIRSAAQMVSYELGLGLSIIAVVLTNSAFASESGAAALSLRTTVDSQVGFGFLGWNFIWQFPAFVIFAICAIAETNRAPFDLPEAEQELTGGFHTEYSSFRFAMFFMGEYAHMVTLTSVGVCLFFGGWLSPFAGVPGLALLNVERVPVLGGLMPVVWFFLKVFVWMFCFIWMRFTLPRLRWDQLMRLGWLVLLPAGVVWVTLVAAVQGVAIWLAGGGGPLGEYNPVTVYKGLIFLASVALGLIILVKRGSARPSEVA